jgi:N-acetyl-anhydromuramyl-L-alanine amidase AmpD
MINPIKKNCTNWSERQGYKPEIIVVHISAGSLTSMDNWFSTPNSQASAHYGVSKDGLTLYQYVDESKMAWANGRVNSPSFSLYKPGVNPNLYTISIENEGYDLIYASSAQLDLLCELIRDICKRHSIPMDRDHIIGHFQIDSVNRPYCPSPDHSIMDKIVARLKTDTEEMVSLMCPKSRVEVIKSIINLIK